MQKLITYITEKLKINKSTVNKDAVFTISKDNFREDLKTLLKQLQDYKTIKLKNMTSSDCYYLGITIRDDSAFSVRTVTTKITLCVPTSFTSSNNRFESYEIRATQSDPEELKAKSLFCRNVYSVPGGHPSDIFQRRSKYVVYNTRDIYEIPIDAWPTLEDDFKEIIDKTGIISN